MGNQYEQSGDFGIGKMEDGNIEGKVGGVINEGNQCKDINARLNLQSSVNGAAGNVQGNQIINNNYYPTPKSSICENSPLVKDISNNDQTIYEAMVVLTAKLRAGNKAEFQDQIIEIKAIVAHLEKRYGIHLTIMDITEGSIKLRLGGSQEDIEKLKDLFESGELTEILGIPVQDVRDGDEALSILNNAEKPKTANDEAIVLDAETFPVSTGKEIKIDYLHDGSKSKNSIVTLKNNAEKIKNSNRNYNDFVFNIVGEFRSKEIDLSKANLSGVNLSKADLSGANLSEADLSGANLSEADLSGANLQAACLNWANLTKVQAIGTDFSYAQITGCSLENWNIDSTTKLKDVESRFVYLLENAKPNTDDRERRPSSGEFQPGEFTKLFEEVLNTVDLIFRNGIDWQAFMSSFKQVQVENEDTELNIQSIENKGDGVWVVKVSVPEETDKEKIHSDFVQIYDDTVRKLEVKYQAELQDKEKEIAIDQQQNENMISFIKKIVPNRLIIPNNEIQKEKLVIIRFTNGDLETGFATVKAHIWSDGSPLPITFSAKLPPEKKIARLYQQWHHQYKDLSNHYQFRGLMPKIKKKENLPTNFSDQEFPGLKRDFKKLAQTLAASINQWLNSQDFSRVRNQLRMQLNPSNRVRLVIETEDIKMRRLPWHCWDFFQDYPLAEVALSNSEDNQFQKLIPPRDKIRMLAILGNDEGINIEADRQFLESLPDAEAVFLIQPKRQELDKYLLDEKSWDIFFFSGHSDSDVYGNTDCFYLGNEKSSTDKLTVKELENALKNAISKGLQLVIFNSCNGLSLAKQLAELHIPQIIVMRERVPDAVAQKFLKNFFSLFANGESIYVSLRRSREMLQSIEDEFPCASWLPVIYQNQSEVPKTWQKFCYNKRPKFEDLLAIIKEAIEAETALTADDKNYALEQVKLLAELGKSREQKVKSSANLPSEYQGE